MKTATSKYTTFLVIALFCSVLYAKAQSSDKIIGKYWSPKKDGKIEIYKVANKYFGKIIWGNKPSSKDTKNPNPELRSREIIGMVILTNFKYKDEQYQDGEIYDPLTGKTYSCKMWLENQNLKVRGFIGISILGRTEIFERIKI
ncbi:MAG: DUF2147 domain-containing protein [Sphingobacteriales bacterium]|nr:MAG: DUF2147 domain-containing protein [Sphingobacteriales bacterium]TAF79034.1 MAG: DUF2147 domain-containing protein [Sphingobacteriales bacterium]